MVRDEIKRLSDNRNDSSLIYGRIQPQDTFTECFILSKILSNNAIGTVALILKPDDFYLESHNLIYSACINVFVEGQNVDLLSCRNELMKLEKLEQVGGIQYLTKIVQDHYTFHDVEAMSHLIRDISIKRKVIQLCTEKINTAFQNSSYGYQLLAETLNSIEEIQESMFSKDTKNIEFAVNEILDRLDKEAIIGYPTGIKELDDVTNGILPPDLTVIAASPGEGKSVLALQFAKAMAKKGLPGMFFSLEMKLIQIIERMVSQSTGYSVNEIRNKEYWCNDSKTKEPILKTHISEKTKEFKKLPIHFHDSGLDSYLDIGAIVKAEIVRKKLKWVIIDYLQLLPTGSSKGQSRDVEIGKMTRFLKVLAMKLNIPIIILSQVNRQRNRKKYTLQDLRESGNIEQDADNVFFIFRPKMHGHKLYDIEGHEDIEVDDQTCIIQVEKARSGQPGSQILVEFHGKTSEFKSSNSSSTNRDHVTEFIIPNIKPNDESLPF
jgi:replicative DNA helicase